MLDPSALGLTDMLDFSIRCLTIMSCLSTWGLATLPCPNACCCPKTLGCGNEMKTIKMPLHVALFLLKPKNNFVFELFQ